MKRKGLASYRASHYQKDWTSHYEKKRNIGLPIMKRKGLAHIGLPIMKRKGLAHIGLPTTSHNFFYDQNR